MPGLFGRSPNITVQWFAPLLHIQESHLAFFPPWWQDIQTFAQFPHTFQANAEIITKKLVGHDCFLPQPSGFLRHALNQWYIIKAAKISSNKATNN
jgi:hypothetical protein